MVSLFSIFITYICRSIPKLRESNTLTSTSTKPMIPKMTTSKKNAARTKTFLKNEYNVTRNMDQHQTDSGFESFERYSGLKYKKIKSRASVIKSESKFVPFDVSFVGGKFSLNVFKVLVNRICLLSFTFLCVPLPLIERRSIIGITTTSTIFSCIVPAKHADCSKFAGQNHSIVTV